MKLENTGIVNAPKVKSYIINFLASIITKILSRRFNTSIAWVYVIFRIFLVWWWRYNCFCLYDYL